MKNVKIQKILNIISIVGVFLIAGIVVLSITNVIKLSSFSLNLIISLGILCVGCIMIMPGAKRIDLNKKDIVGWIVVALSIITILLWFILQIFGNDIVTAIVNNALTGDILLQKIGIIKTTAFVSILSILFILSVNLYNQLKMKMLSLQIIIGVSNLIVFIFLCFYIFGFYATPEKVGLAVNPLANKFGISIFLISVFFSAISSGIITGKQNREAKRKGLISVNESKEEVTETTDSKLVKLKDLFDKGVITKEEYDAKRKDIIDKL